MTFLVPQFLYGLFALSIPVIIHLFNFRRTKKVYFSNTQFLKNIKTSTKSKLRLKHWLVLAARLLFVFFLVVAFAQPFLPAPNEQSAEKEVSIYLDNSLSMSAYLEGNLRAVDAALTYVNKIVELYPTTTRFRFITNDFDSYSFSDHSEKEIKDKTAETDLSGVNRSFQDVLQRMEIIKSYSNKFNDVYWISDFQKSTLGNLTYENLDSTDNYFWLPVQYQRFSNVFVDSVYLTNPYLLPGQKNVVNVTVANDGIEEYSALALKFFVNEIQTGNVNISLNPQGKTTVSFELPQRLNQFNECRIAIEENNVLFDNDFYFALNQSAPALIVEIKEDVEDTYVQKVYGNTDLFEIESFRVQNVDYSKVKSCNLLIINEVSNLPASLVGAVTDFVQQGGNLLIIPANDQSLANLSFVGTPTRLTPENEQFFLNMAPPNLNNPFFKDIFVTTDEVIEMPQAKAIANLGPSGRTLLEFRNEEAFLKVHFSGDGRVYWAATPFSDDYTTFHKHSIFVPVMYKIATGSVDEFSQLYYNLDQSVLTASIDSAQKESLYTLVRDEVEVIPGQRLQGSSLTMEVPKNTLAPGFYELTDGDSQSGLLAFNYAKNESILEAFSGEDLEEIFAPSSNTSVFDIQNSEQLDKEIKASLVGTALWKYAILLALLFLLVETALLRFL